MFFKNPFDRKLPRKRGFRLKEILDRDERIREIIARFEEKNRESNDNTENSEESSKSEKPNFLDN